MPKYSKINLFLSSDSNFTENTDLANGSVSINLEEYKEIQHEHSYVQLNEIGICNKFDNITSTNNLIYYTDDVLDLVKYSITIPDGDYSSDGLNDIIQILLYQNDATHIGVFGIEGYQNDRILWTLQNGWLVNLAANTPYTMLGHSLNDTIPSGGALTTALTYEFATAIPVFNPVKRIKVIVDNMNLDSMFNNNDIHNVIGEFMIEHEKNSYKSYSLMNKVEANNMSIFHLKELFIRIIDQDNNPVTLSKDFYLSISIGDFDLHD